MPVLALALVFLASWGPMGEVLVRPDLGEALEAYAPWPDGLLALLAYAIPATILAVTGGTFWAWGLHRRSLTPRAGGPSWAWGIYLALPPVAVAFMVLLAADRLAPGLRHQPAAALILQILSLTIKEGAYAGVLVMAILGRLDPRLDAMARSLGASGPRSFLTVYLPLVWRGLTMVSLQIFLFNLGSWEVPVLLGRTHPKPWPVVVYQAWIDGGPSISLAGREASIMISGLQVLAVLGYFVLLPRAPGRGGRQ